jgi:RNA polymerase sigma factor (sigma-70 family)
VEDFEPGGAGSLQAYLRRAVLNRLRDELRRKGRQPQMVDLEALSSPGQSPIEDTLGRDTVEEYERALAALRPDEQEAIIGRVEMGYSYEELSRVLGKPTPDAARKAAQRALVRLAEEMTRGGR